MPEKVKSEVDTIPKLCIVSPWNYPLFNPENQSHFGGWEVRVALIAKELAKRKKFGVSLVVGDHGQPHIETREGVTIYSWIGREIWGIPLPVNQPGKGKKNIWVRALNWLNRSLWGTSQPYSQPRLKSGRVGQYLIEAKSISIYDEVDADIYMMPGNSQFSGELAFYCRQRGKKYVFLAGSDIDFNSEYKTEPDKLDLYSVPYSLKTYAIENASLHIAQNEHQASLLYRGYGRSAIVVKNPINVTPAFPRNPAAKSILWVGKSDERVKRPSIVFELARRLPEYEFIMVMPLGILETHQQCLEKAKTLPNIALIGRIPFDQIEQYFAEAKLHINTSTFEGFPNTFLQATKYGVPTVAIKVDPGEMLSRYGCGVSCNDDIKRLEKNVRLFMTDSELYAQASNRCLDYVRTYHDKDKIIPQYEQALISLIT